MPVSSRSQKRFVGKKPNTNVALTAVGRQRIARHWSNWSA
jgi:hypothetical protein